MRRDAGSEIRSGWLPLAGQRVGQPGRLLERQVQVHAQTYGERMPGTPGDVARGLHVRMLRILVVMSRCCRRVVRVGPPRGPSRLVPAPGEGSRTRARSSRSHREAPEPCYSAPPRGSRPASPSEHCWRRWSSAITSSAQSPMRTRVTTPTPRDADRLLTAGPWDTSFGLAWTGMRAAWSRAMWSALVHDIVVHPGCAHGSVVLSPAVHSLVGQRRPRCSVSAEAEARMGR